MSAGGYCKTAHGAKGEEGKTGKRKQNVRHYKPFSSSRGRREIGRRCRILQAFSSENHSTIYIYNIY